MLCQFSSLAESLCKIQTKPQRVKFLIISVLSLLYLAPNRDLMVPTEILMDIRGSASLLVYLSELILASPYLL